MAEEKYFVVFHGPSDGSEKSLELIANKLAATKELKAKQNIIDLLLNPPAVVLQNLKRADAETWMTLIESMGGIAEYLEGDVPELPQSSSKLPVTNTLSLETVAKPSFSLEGDSGSKNQATPEAPKHSANTIHAAQKEGFDLENQILDSLHNAPTAGVAEAAAKFTQRRLYGEMSDESELSSSEELPVVKDKRKKILMFALVFSFIIGAFVMFRDMEQSKPEIHITLNKDVLEKFITEQDHILGRKKIGDDEKTFPYWKGEINGANFTSNLTIKTNDIFPQKIDIEMFGRKSEAPTPAEYAAGILDHPWLFKGESLDIPIELERETKTDVIFKFQHPALLFVSYLESTNRLVGDISGEIQLNKSNNLLTGSFEASYHAEDIDKTTKWYQIEKVRENFNAFLKENYILNKREKAVVVAEAQAEDLASAPSENDKKPAKTIK